MNYFDLERQVRENLPFRDELVKLISEIQTLSLIAPGRTDLEQKYHGTFRAFYRLCRRNPVLLTPLLFPSFPKRTPMSFRRYPFAFQMFSLMQEGYMVFRGSRQIAKSSSFSARQVLNANLIPGFVSTYICPRSQYLTTYADRLRDIYGAYKYYKVDNNLRNNLFYKELANGSRIQLLHILGSAANARSKSTDEILFDEYQDFDPDLELEVLQIQSASENKITIYAGTSLTTNTALEEKFNHSSQGFWVVRCRNGHFNLPLPEHGIMDMIQPQGPSCVKCGQLLDMTQGNFEHAFPDRLAKHRVGFHVPQIVVPAVYENRQRWREIMELKRRGDLRKFNQEILGIPSEEGEREITKRHLQLMCILGSDLGALWKKAISGQGYELIISGFDWGGSDYDPGRKIKASTTVHAILGFKGDGTVDILHIQRFEGMKYDEITASFRREHERYRAKYAASDFGVGHYYNEKIREFQDPMRHFIFHYLDRTKGLMCNMDSSERTVNHWALNKTDSLSQLYAAIRTQRIRCFAWEQAEEFLQDFLNVYRVPNEGPNGSTRFTYVGHPARTTDVMMAVNYAFQMGRLLLGEDVTNSPSLLEWANSQRGGGHDIYSSEHLQAFSG